MARHALPDIAEPHIHTRTHTRALTGHGKTSTEAWQGRIATQAHGMRAQISFRSLHDDGRRSAHHLVCGVCKVGGSNPIRPRALAMRRLPNRPDGRVAHQGQVDRSKLEFHCTAHLPTMACAAQRGHYGMAAHVSSRKRPQTRGRLLSNESCEITSTTASASGISGHSSAGRAVAEIWGEGWLEAWSRRSSAPPVVRSASLPSEPPLASWVRSWRRTGGPFEPPDARSTFARVATESGACRVDVGAAEAGSTADGGMMELAGGGCRCTAACAATGVL